jgi:hypothetical protein
VIWGSFADEGTTKLLPRVAAQSPISPVIIGPTGSRECNRPPVKKHRKKHRKKRREMDRATKLALIGAVGVVVASLVSGTAAVLVAYVTRSGVPLSSSAAPGGQAGPATTHPRGRLGWERATGAVAPAHVPRSHRAPSTTGGTCAARPSSTCHATATPACKRPRPAPGSPRESPSDVPVSPNGH